MGGRFCSNCRDPLSLSGWVYRLPLQGKSLAIPVCNDLPFTSKDIPIIYTMIFTNKDNLDKKSTRIDIKVTSNIQIAPPRYDRALPEESITQQRPSHYPQEQQWVIVERKGKILNEREGKSLARAEKIKLSKTAARSVKGSDAAFSYADALKRIRKEISLKDLDIQMPKIRKGMSSNTIIEIAGPDSIQEADRLAAEMQRVLQGKARILHPNIRGEIKLLGMDESQ